MKLNLPSTLTSKKMLVLSLSALSSINGVEGGKNFSDCISAQGSSYSAIYNQLNNFNFNSSNSNEVIKLCCDNSECVKVNVQCDGVHSPFWCQKLNQTTFCEDGGIECGGIVGDTPIITNTTAGSCPYTYNDCASSNSGLTHYYDNNGVTCSPNTTTYSLSSPPPCFLQVTSSPSSTVPSSSTSSISPTSPVSTSKSSPAPTNNNLAIGLGAGIGGGGTLLIGGLVLWCFKDKIASAFSSIFGGRHNRGG